VALDIGTSKVVAMVGERSDNGVIEVIGIGTQRSRGLKKGVVVNIESTVQSIQRAVEEAELMAAARSIRSMPALPAATSAASTRTASSPSASAR
jgi:cell division protein FtsA